MEPLSSLLLSAEPLLGVQFALVLGSAGLLLRTHCARCRHIYQLPFDAGQLHRELLAGVFVVAFGAVTVAVCGRVSPCASGR